MKKSKYLLLLTCLLIFVGLSQDTFAEDLIKEILRPVDKQSLETDELISFFEDKVVIFMGEVHSNRRHHQIHAHLIEMLISKYGHVNLAMEALPKDSQGVIDQFVSGKIDEREFLRQVKWNEFWGFDYAMYKPIVDKVISSGGKIWGIGPDQQRIKKIARGEAIGSSEESIPKLEPYPGPNSYMETVRHIYNALRQHREMGAFEHFFKAQLARDELMAENLKEAFLRDPKRTVVIAGNQHIVNYWGIPFRFLRRLSLPVATLVVYSGSQGKVLEPYLNDFLVISP